MQLLTQTPEIVWLEVWEDPLREIMRLKFMNEIISDIIVDTECHEKQSRRNVYSGRSLSIAYYVFSGY